MGPRFAKLRAPSAGRSAAAAPPAADPDAAATTATAPVRAAARGADPVARSAPITTGAARADPPGSAPAAATSFRPRARVRRRVRYLRQIRELAFRDLGGFILESRRLSWPRPDIVEAKLTGLLAIDHEIRTLEQALDERRELTVLREPGITVCARCGSIHASDANFCSGCGLPRGPLAPPAPSPPTKTTPGDQPTVSMPPLAGR